MSNKGFVGRCLWGATLVAALAFSFSAPVSAYPGEHGPHDREHHEHHERNPRDIDAKLHVVNDTEFDMYITVSGRNMGKVDSHSSRDFSVKCGDQYVEAEIGDSHTGKDVSISPHERHGEVTFYKSNFSRLPEVKSNR